MRIEGKTETEEIQVAALKVGTVFMDAAGDISLVVKQNGNSTLLFMLAANFCWELRPNDVGYNQYARQVFPNATLYLKGGPENE